MVEVGKAGEEGEGEGEGVARTSSDVLWARRRSVASRKATPRSRSAVDSCSMVADSISPPSPLDTSSDSSWYSCEHGRKGGWGGGEGAGDGAGRVRRPRHAAAR